MIETPRDKEMLGATLALISHFRDEVLPYAAQTQDHNAIDAARLADKYLLKFLSKSTWTRTAKDAQDVQQFSRSSKFMVVSKDVTAEDFARRTFYLTPSGTVHKSDQCTGAMKAKGITPVETLKGYHKCRYCFPCETTEEVNYETKR